MLPGRPVATISTRLRRSVRTIAAEQSPSGVVAGSGYAGLGAVSFSTN